MIECVKLKFDVELNWCYWFIGHNKLPPNSETIEILSSNPDVLSTAMDQINNPKISKPQISKLPVKSLENTLKGLLNGEYSDITLKLKDGEMMKLHKCILGIFIE